MSETSKFTEDILTNARERAESIIREAETETEHASDEAKIAISREVEAIIRNARADADAVKRRQISEARHRSKLREQEEKDRIMREVLNETKKRTFDLVGDEMRYLPFLTHLIESGIHELGDKSALIHLNETDLRRMSTSNLEQRIDKMLSGQVKVEWSKEPIAASGGAIISSPDGMIRIVNTLDQRLEALESKLLIEAGKSLFGE
jgi:V/A-type H+-transporting ATPase subunit E